VATPLTDRTEGQITLRYPASEPARELVCDMLASC